MDIPYVVLPLMPTYLCGLHMLPPCGQDVDSAASLERYAFPVLSNKSYCKGLLEQQ